MTSNALLLFVLGTVLLVAGAEFLVRGASRLAVAAGISPLVVGLTVVAFGTSAPELAVTVGAAYSGQADVALGNVVGSNIFNILAVLGLGSVVAPQGVAVAPGALTFDVPVMIAVAVACLPIFFTGYTIARWEGLVFLAYYVAYTLFLVLEATEHDALPAFRAAMSFFVLPLTALTLAVLALRAMREKKAESASIRS